MATAPFQLWMDLTPIASAVRVSSTVTVTTTTPHAVVTGAYIQLGSALGTAGTSMNGVYSVTVTSGTTFTLTSSGSAGTADITTAFIAYDLMSPLIDYGSASRQAALYVDLDSISMSASGDGSGVTFGVTINQDDTPSDGPWFNLIPDQTRIRLIKANTGATPALDKSDVYFTGSILSLDASINGSGQGTTTDVQLQDANALLERLMIYGNQVSPKKGLTDGGFVRAANVTTVTTPSAHGYGVGQKVEITSVNGGLNQSFNGAFTISATPTSRTFQYSNAGTATTGNQWQTISNAVLRTKARNRVLVTTLANNWFNERATVTIRGVTSSNAQAQNYINGTHSGQNVRFSGSNQVMITLPSSVFSNTTFNVSSGQIKGEPLITPVGSPDQRIFLMRSGESEAAAASRMLTIINQYKDEDYPLNRLIDTADDSLIIGSTTELLKKSAQIPATSLRSALDTVVETFSGQDQKERRYYIDAAGRLNYRLADSASAPTYATAPYSIITSGAGTPDTTTGKATLAPYSLKVTWDHDTTKSVVFTPSSNGRKEPAVVQDYTQVGYTARPGAPILDQQLDFPTATGNAGAQMQTAAKSYFLERHKPLLSGTFTLRGAGTAAHNEYGFSAGYAQTGASTFALVNRWEPGQWVEVTSAELGLSGFYRVEAVEWSLEPGAFLQVITITFNRRPQNGLTNLVAAGGA
jgi:hypothetical protein